jgi:plastocyanin
MNPRRTVALLAAPVIVLAVIAGVACGDDDEDVDDDATETQTPRPEAEEFDLAADDDLTFTPDAIELEVGESLDIHMTNNGNTAHTFTLDELNIDVEVPASNDETIPLTASEPGEYTFYCKFHDESGMVGTLRIAVSEGGEGDPTEAASDPTEAASEGGGSLDGY